MINIADTLPKFKIEKTDKKITAHTGLTLVSESFRGFGIKRDIEGLMPGPGSNRGYKAEEYIEPMILMLAGGGKFLEDIRVIEVDRVLLEGLKIKDVPSPDAYGNWLRRMGLENNALGLKRLGEINGRFTHRLLSLEERTEYTLDIDATFIESNKQDAKMSYKGMCGYMPMLGFLAENSICIYDDFREGNMSPSFRNLEVLKSCISKMPKGKKIKKFRSDSAGYQASIINECEKKGITFTITADMDSAVKSAVGAIEPKSWVKLLDKNGRNIGRSVSETIHCMNNTEKSFRLIVQRWRIKREDTCQAGLFEGDVDLSGYRYYVIATNSKDTAQRVVLWHNGRGNSENYNKEVKSGFGMEYMPCGDFKANAVFFRIGIMAYNLIVGMKRNLFPEDWLTKTISTIRWQFINTAGKLVNHGRQIILKLCGISDEIFNIWENARSKLRLYADTC